MLWALATGWTRPVSGLDLEQARLNVALAPPSAAAPIVQTFRPRHDGLNHVEILLAQSVGQEAQGVLTLRLADDRGAVVAQQRWSATQLRHNQALALRFAPQPQSRGRQYRLTLEGDGHNPFGAWAYDLDVLEGGELTAPRVAGGDLRLVTRYRLSAQAALRTVGAMMQQDGWILLTGLLLLPLPGCLLLLAAERRIPRLDAGAWCSLALASGMALWPLLWLWLTLFGGRWTPGAMRLALGAGWLAAAALWLYRRIRRAPQPRRAGRLTATHAALLLVLLAGLAGRLLAVRDLAFPPWVDSSRHALISRVMLRSGQAPDDYAPLLAVDDFSYHFGFHALAAGVVMAADAPLPRTLLITGQLLNALAALSVYGAAWLVTRRRAAALLAAFLVAIPFFFPAYYLTWGRYTQLSGALLLAPLAALTWLAARAARGWQRPWWLVGLLAAGLFLIHVRVFLVYLPFALLAWAAAAVRRRASRATRQLGTAALLALLLAAPRLWQLAALATPGRGFLAHSGEAYAAFPTGYLTAGWERWFLLLGGAALLLLALLAWKGRRQALLGVALGGWMGAVALLLSGRLPGLPPLWLINLNSAYILIFVPLALLLALAYAHLWPWLQRRALLSVAAALLLGAAIGAGAIFGLQQQATILNETTILARPADGDGLRWVQGNTPPEARFAVNSWQWLGQTWAAGDGGAWLLPVTGRQGTTPPVDYIGDRDLFQRVIAFNEQASTVENWSDPAAAAWLGAQGVTHVYVGARGGFLDPAALARNPQLALRYARDGVFIFELLQDAAPN